MPVPVINALVVPVTVIVPRPVGLQPVTTGYSVWTPTGQSFPTKQ